VAYPENYWLQNFDSVIIISYLNYKFIISWL
jgi:hypothetical protein